MSNLVNIFILSVRPKTLLVGAAPVILGYGIAKQYTESLSVTIFLVTILATVLFGELLLMSKKNPY